MDDVPGRSRLDRVAWARLLVVAVIAMDLALLFGGAALKPGYSQSAQYISELNATGTPWAWQIGWFGFVPLSLLIAAFLLVAAPQVRVQGVSRAGYWLLFSQSIAYFGSALVPCDAGCPGEGSISQGLHNLLGLLTYLLGGLGILLLAFAPALHAASRVALVATALLWFLLFVMMLVPELAPWRGLLQRFAELLFYAVLLFIAWAMMPALLVAGRTRG